MSPLIFRSLERVEEASFPLPDPNDAGDAARAALLRTALRLGFRATAGPFRSLASVAVEPRPYQPVPLLMALRQDVVRMLIADDVGIAMSRWRTGCAHCDSRTLMNMACQRSCRRGWVR